MDFLITSHKPKKTSQLLFLILFPILINNHYALVSKAQTVTDLSGPTSDFISVPGFPDALEFQVDTSTACPVPTFNLTSNYSQVRDQNNPIIFPTSPDTSRRRANGFSVAAGVTIPLTGNGDACQELLEAKVQNVKQFNEKNELIAQSEMLRECFKLYELDINFEDPTFDKDGSSGALFPCRGLSRVFASQIKNNKSSVSPKLKEYQIQIENPDASSLIPESGIETIIIDRDRR